MDIIAGGRKELSYMDGLVCVKCGKELELMDAVAEYLDNRFTEKVPGCPVCGQIYISEETVNGKIAAVESTLEQK